MDRRARRGCTLVRRYGGVEAHRRELAHIEIELLAGDLQQRGGRALAKLALAEEHGRGVVGVYGNPAVDKARIRRTAGRSVRCGAGGRRRRQGEANDHDSASP
jgi:hypothetical protein